MQSLANSFVQSSLGAWVARYVSTTATNLNRARGQGRIQDHWVIAEMKGIVRCRSDQMPEFRKEMRCIFPRRVNQHIHRESLDLLVRKRFEIRDLRGLDPALAKGFSDTLIHILNNVAKSLGSNHLCRTEAGDGETIFVRERRQLLFADQSSKDRT